MKNLILNLFRTETLINFLLENREIDSVDDLIKVVQSQPVEKYGFDTCYGEIELGRDNLIVTLQGERAGKRYGPVSMNLQEFSKNPDKLVDDLMGA